MTWLSGIVLGMTIAFVIIVVRSLRYLPTGRPNYEEKELTATAYDYQPQPKSGRFRRFHIKDEGVIIKKEFCQC